MHRLTIMRAATLTACLGLSSCAVFHRPHGAANPSARPADSPAPAATAKASTVATPAPTPNITATTTRTAAPRRIGVVRVIGNGQHFVLIEVPPTGTVPLPFGQTLRCCPAPDGDLAMTATLRISPERRRPYIVADVVNGEPHVGDTVFLGPAPPSSNAAPAGSAVLPTATSGVLPIVLPAPGSTPKTP